MNILLLGGTGLIGSYLTKILTPSHRVTILSRNPSQYKKNFSSDVELQLWNGDIDTLKLYTNKTDCIINLLGENIAHKAWSPEQKEKLYSSRIDSGRKLVEAIQVSSKKPEILIQASAVGFYELGNDLHTMQACTEESPAGTSFLSRLAVDWENSTKEVEAMEIRRCIIRTSPVLSAEGGILQSILPPFRYYLGGYPRTGRQPFAWIHIEDEARAILHLIEHAHCTGIYNLVAPESHTIQSFCQTLASTIHKPCLFPIPQWILRFALGEFAEELILSGQYVLPTKLEQENFIFNYPTLQNALASLF